MFNPTDYFSEWFGKPGVSEAAIAALEQEIGMEFPNDYVELLRYSNGGEGRIGKLYVTLWSSDEIRKRDEQHRISSELPTLVGIADDGPHFYGFDKSLRCKSIVRIPLGDFHCDMWQRVAGSFTELLKKIRKNEIW